MNVQHPSRRKPVNLSLDEKLVTEARALGVNLSRACEAGLMVELKAAREAQWLADNREAIESSNDWAASNGLPLAQYRRF